MGATCSNCTCTTGEQLTEYNIGIVSQYTTSDLYHLCRKKITICLPISLSTYSQSYGSLSRCRLGHVALEFAVIYRK